MEVLTSTKWFLRCLLMSSWHRTRGRERERDMEMDMGGVGTIVRLLWHHRGSYIPGGMEPAIPHFTSEKAKRRHSKQVGKKNPREHRDFCRTHCDFLYSLTTYLSYSSTHFHTILWPLTLWTWAQLECTEIVGLLTTCRCSWPPLCFFFYCVMDYVQVGALLSLYTDWFFFGFF